MLGAATVALSTAVAYLFKKGETDKAAAATKAEQQRNKDEAAATARYEKLEKQHGLCEEKHEAMRGELLQLSVKVAGLEGEAKGINAGKTAIVSAQQSIEGLVSELREQLIRGENDD